MCVINVPAQPPPQYPIPISEYAEKTAPNTVTFLSYPKYYRTPDGKLTQVVTNLVVSEDPNWDYEVTTGIWTLHVRTDGTFQAAHKGNVFTYRLADIGVGRGSVFRSLSLGPPNWKNYQVIGDTIRWSNVFPNIDLTVRYVHDILKVDVILKEAFVRQIRSQVLNGTLNAGEYLTARFDIPQVSVFAEARQGGEIRDLYQEPLSIDRPLEFVREGKVIERIRPVEAFVLDENSQPIDTEDFRIRTAQLWQLQEDGPGVAEMSVNLGDLATAPEGDLLIDPTTIFDPASQDTRLKHNSSTNYGSDESIYWYDDDHLVFGFDVDADSLESNKGIVSATLEFFEWYSSIDSGVEARAHEITTNWNEGTAHWSSPWSASGGDYENPAFESPPLILPDSDDEWVKFDVTASLKSRARPWCTMKSNTLIDSPVRKEWNVPRSASPVPSATLAEGLRSPVGESGSRHSSQPWLWGLPVSHGP